MVIVLTTFAYSCANVVAPMGGPKDEEPPVVLRSVPANFSTHYDGRDVRIYFDEYVTLKNIRQNLLVSPPLENDPEIKIRGRSIIMSVSDTLLPNTTYNFFFGESVVDITESNPIPNFQYVISTGAYVDSLSVRGRVRNAFTHLPEDSVFVMMYSNANVSDSAPLLRKPVYLSKTDSSGVFTINNMREDDYLMFALKDINSSFIYDTPDEKIAFIDSLVSPVFHGFEHAMISIEPGNQMDTIVEVHDSSVSDTLSLPQSTLMADSLLADSILREFSQSLPSYEMMLFQEKDTVQRVVSATLVREGKINIIFRIPADSVAIRDYEKSLPDNWYLPEFSSHKDTLSLWIFKEVADTLKLEISDRGIVADSVTVATTPRVAQTRGRGRAQPTQDTIVNLTALSLVSRVHPYYKNFELRSSTPLKSFNDDRFELYLNDTIPIDVNFSFVDSIQRTLRMDFQPEPDSSYVLYIPQGSVTDIFGAENDSLNIAFTVNNETKYSTITLGIELPEKEDQQYIVQLVDERFTKVIAEKIITEGGTYAFKHLPVGTFQFRLVFDENKNNSWDTGHYLRAIQPEQVVIYPEQVVTRLNWEIEVLWNPQVK